MTRKHFEEIAAVLRTLHPAGSGADIPSNRRFWIRACERMADMCAAANPRFDRARFIQACIPAGMDDPAWWPK